MTRIFELLRIALASVLIGIGGAPLTAQPSPSSSAGDKDVGLVLRGGRVFDSRGTLFQANLSVSIRGRRILTIREDNPDGIVAPDPARTIALDGLYLIPGLIDLHTHFVLYPYDQANWNDQVLKESLELRVMVVLPVWELRIGRGIVEDLGE